MKSFDRYVLKALIAATMVIPASALASPYVGLGYTDIGLQGHSGRPGISLVASNLYPKDVLLYGQATYARSYYGMHADLGKLIPADGLVFEPYLSAGFLNLNYQAQETGFNTVTQSTYGYPTTYQTPYSYAQAASVQDLYGLAGVNVNVPISHRVVFQVGGGYGHTLDALSGSGGAAYKGKAEIAFALTGKVTADLHASYMHVPAASMADYGCGLSYHF
jgi:hypothetical protein